MPICWHNSLNIAFLKYFALSTVMCLSTPISADYALLEEFFDCGGAQVCKQLCFYPFCEIFDCNYYERVTVLRWSQLSYNVNVPSLQRPR
jgi:hypothetical protein